jgi:hypothetical protein
MVLIGLPQLAIFPFVPRLMKIVDLRLMVFEGAAAALSRAHKMVQASVQLRSFCDGIQRMFSSNRVNLSLGFDFNMVLSKTESECRRSRIESELALDADCRRLRLSVNCNPLVSPMEK